MPHPYTEDQLVEQPAIGLFAELGWTIAYGNPHPQPFSQGKKGAEFGGLLVGRDTTSEVVLVPRLRAALERLNSTLPPEAITFALDELTRDRSAMVPEAANREVYLLLKEGVPGSVAGRWQGRLSVPAFMACRTPFQPCIGFRGQ